MSCIAHISDLHFGRVNDTVAEALQEELNGRKAALVIISGDLTQRAKAEEFRQAVEYIRGFTSPTLCIPGNHDIPKYNLLERFADPYHRYRKHVSDNLCPFFEGEDFAALGLNTARPYGWYFDWSRGRINRTQMQRIHKTFTKVSDRKIRIVVTHHPFLLPEGDLSRGLVGRSRDALREMSHAGVDLLLAGHLHKTYSGHAETGQEIIERILVAQVATSTSTRLRNESNAYNWIEINGGNICLETHVWDEGARVFAPAETHDYRIARHPVPEERQVKAV